MGFSVATVLTVYGIETLGLGFDEVKEDQVATVLTVYGIETDPRNLNRYQELLIVATVLTVYGIETNTS